MGPKCAHPWFSAFLLLLQKSRLIWRQSQSCGHFTELTKFTKFALTVFYQSAETIPVFSHPGAVAMTGSFCYFDGCAVWWKWVGRYVRLRSDRHRFFTDLELQLLLKQGQVEVDAHGFIRDYRHCVLIHRSVIEELNQQIKATVTLLISCASLTEFISYTLMNTVQMHMRNMSHVQYWNGHHNILVLFCEW